MYKVYKTKAILNIHKHCDSGWFWNKYSAFPYIGCEWSCEYCYCRDEKYNPHKPSGDKKVLEFNDAFCNTLKLKNAADNMF